MVSAGSLLTINVMNKVGVMNAVASLKLSKVCACVLVHRCLVLYVLEGRGGVLSFSGDGGKCENGVARQQSSWRL